ncbi:hypothetical protein PG995_005392 [Apiospora arundinis]
MTYNDKHVLDDKTWLSDFWKPLGGQQSQGDCTVSPSRSNNCDQPDAKDLQNYYDDGCGWQYMVVLSAAHLHVYLQKMYEAVSAAGTTFDPTQAILTSTFYPNPPTFALESAII